VFEPVQPSILDVAFSDQHLSRSTHYNGSLTLQWEHNGSMYASKYFIKYDRFFKEGNGTPQEEYHDLHIGFSSSDMHALPLLRMYPHQAVPIIIEKNILRSPEGKKELIVDDLETWVVNALRSEELSHRVRKGLSNCIKGM